MLFTYISAMSGDSSSTPLKLGGGDVPLASGSDSNAVTAASGGASTAQQQNVSSIDIASLARLLQQAQQQQQQQNVNPQKVQKSSTTSGDGHPTMPPGFHESLLQDIKDRLNYPTNNTNNNNTSTPSSLPPPSSSDNNAASSSNMGNDPQTMMEQIATLTKKLEAEKYKSKALQDEKKREMKGFLTGIRDYVNNLDGVKDPEAKDKFMQVSCFLFLLPSFLFSRFTHTYTHTQKKQGMENMANSGIPNGVYDIMVSASNTSMQHMKTIEALTKGYSDLKNKYEGPGQFATESSRFVDPTISIINSGTKRKEPDQDPDKVPMGMWDAFGDDVAKLGYANQTNLFG